MLAAELGLDPSSAPDRTAVGRAMTERLATRHAIRR